MKFPKILYTGISSIHRAAFWLATFSMLSATLGLVRDRWLAAHFGASRSLDIYYAAFRVPDFVYTVLLLLAGATAVIPVFLERFSEDRRKAEELLGSLAILFLVVLSVLAGAAYFGMPTVIALLLPGFSVSDQAAATMLSRILLLSPLFLGFSNIVSSVTQSLRHFVAFALSPVFYNLGIIFGILFFLPRWGLAGLAWGVVLGAFFHMAIQIPSLMRVGIFPRAKLVWNADIKNILQLSVPRTLALTATQVMTSILTGVASTLAGGSIAVFHLASNLQSIPITLFGLSYSVAAFPQLAEYSLRQAKDQFRQQLSVAFRHIVFWSFPVSALMLVLRAQIVRVILGACRFDWVDTRLTAAVLMLLTFAVMLQSLGMLLVRAFYAEHETMRPVVITIVSVMLSIGATFWLTNVLGASARAAHVLQWAMRLGDIADIRVLALPLGVLVASVTNFIFLYISFWLLFGYSPVTGSSRAILKIILAGMIAGLVAYGGLNVFSHLFDLQTFVGIFLQGLYAGLAGVVAAVGVLWALGSEELREIVRGLAGFLRNDHVPAPEPEKLP